jgi:ABC-type transport system involved in multi-copper enzyme maturation permease subunit
MTAPTRTPGRADSQIQRAGFPRALRAEWTKFRTIRGWVIGMVVAAVLTVFFGVFVAGNASVGCGPTLSGAACIPMVPIGPGGEAVNDSYYLVRRPLAGNGAITVRVTSLAGLYTSAHGPVRVGSAQASMKPGLVPWSKAGIIVAASTRPGSAYAAMMVTGSHGVRLQWNYVNDTAGMPGDVTTASPRWLRLVLTRGVTPGTPGARAGDTVTGYDSADGIHWSLVGSAHLSGLPQTVQAGMFVTSPASAPVTPFLGGFTSFFGPSQATAVFGSVTLRGSWPSAAWTGDNIGQNGLLPGSGAGGFSRAGGRFTVTGQGDIAPVVNGPGSGALGSTAISQPLVGVFAGLIAVVAIGAAFFTSEYRRGLIRVTLTASPRRWQVLAAKALVVGLVAFVVGLVAALAAIWLGLPRLHADGMYVMPVPATTEVRVIVGTAALVAVAAVFAVGVGAILRRSVAAITVVIAAVVLPFMLAVTVLPQSAGDWLLRLSPAAGFAVQQSLPQYPQVDAAYPVAAGYYPLPPWAGFAVLCAWAALALGLAAYLLRRRDA